MKNKLKKMVTATVVSAISLSALGMATTNNSNNDKVVENYSSHNTIETASAKVPNKNIGKIVETSTNNQISYQTNGKQIQFLNNDISEAEIENNITIPGTSESFNLFVLSTTPFVKFTNENDELKINVKFDNKSNETTTENSISSEDKEKLNTYNLKRSILMIYANEIYNNNVNLTPSSKIEINSHIQTLSNSNETSQSNVENLDNKISAINSIINIVESNLAPHSIYYQKNINATYDNFSNTSSSVETINENSSNQEIANKIACTLNGKCNTTESKSNTNTNINTNESSVIEQNNQTLVNNQNRLSRSYINNQNNKNNLQTTPIANQPITPENETQINRNQNSNEISNTDSKNNYRRLPNSVRRRRRNIDNNINSSAIDIADNQNNTLNNRSNFNNNLRNNSFMQENSKTMRANRTNENQSQEKYTNTNSNTITNETNRASRMPYQSTNNNYHR